MAMSAYGQSPQVRRALCMQHCSHPPFPSHCSHACTAGIARCRCGDSQAHHHPGTSAGAPHPTARPSNPARPAHSQLQRTPQHLAPAPAVHPPWQDGRSEVFPTLRLRQVELFSTRSSPPSSSWSTSILSRPRRAPLHLSAFVCWAARSMAASRPHRRPLPPAMASGGRWVCWLSPLPVARLFVR